MAETTCSITSELIADFLSYSTAIYNRALPDIVDGLKVAQRRAIVGLHDLKLLPDSAYSKVSRLEGHVLGAYHPQGGCAGTIINMGQESSFRYTLTQIHGNVGGSIQTGDSIGQMVSEDPPAAARYLEVRASEVTENLYISQLNKGIGQWRDNYDGTRSEPVRFVPSLPALLLTGAQGIASGYACHHIPWNLRDVISAATAYIKNDKITDSALVAKFSNPPEPPAGGRVVKDTGIRDVLLTGKGNIVSYGEWETTDKLPWGKRSTRPALIITRLANGSSEKFLERVRDLADTDRLPGLLDAADHSSRDGIRIVLVMKNVEDRDTILRTLIHSNTGLKHTHNVNCVAVGLDGKPVTAGVRESIREWYGERVKYLCEVHSVEVRKLEVERDKLGAVVKVIDYIDKFLKTVRTAKDKSDAVSKVMKGWKLGEDLARYVIGIPVSTLIATESDRVKGQRDEVLSRIATLTPLCSPGADLDAYICGQIASLRGLCGPARSVWMTESIPETPKTERVLTVKDKVLAEAKDMGISSRAANNWIRDNMGTGKILDKWDEYKAEYSHRLQMTTRQGKKERNEQLSVIRADAVGRGLPSRGKYGWNAFIATCENERIAVVCDKMETWLSQLPNARANTDHSDTGSKAKSGERSGKETKRKSGAGAKGKKPSTGKRRPRTANA